ncbi:MAG: SiaC family regulatory phosphoprotein [Bacteroidales bacterium]|nr:SiaC family regulatory phosphoprotein [Bacteroidales bacterium]
MKEVKDLRIEGSGKIPTIELTALNGEVVLSGRSIPENAANVYEPVYAWVKDYIRNPRKVTNLRLNLDYFNTATSIWIAKIVKALSSISNPDYILFIHLYFNIEDFDEMENEDLRDELAPILDIISDTKISVGVKVYGTDSSGAVIKENMILI